MWTADKISTALHLQLVYRSVPVKCCMRSYSTSSITNDRWRREPCLYIQWLGVKPTRHTRGDINNARLLRTLALRLDEWAVCPSEADYPVPVNLGRRALVAHVGCRPDKTPSRERQVARTERMPVVHAPEWPGPTTCPPGRLVGQRRYLCSSNIKTAGTRSSGKRGVWPVVSERLRGDFSRLQLDDEERRM